MKKTTKAVQAPVCVNGNADDVEYQHILKKLQARFTTRVGVGPVFTTDAEGLWALYLKAFPVSQRKYNSCSSCKRFIETYGGLVTIDEEGRTQSAFWDAAATGTHESKAFASIAKCVNKAKVTGVFLSKAQVWGQPETGDWIT